MTGAWIPVWMSAVSEIGADQPAARRRYRDDDCEFCARNPGMCPPHDASSRCESGKRSHCTCDRCF